MLLCAHCAHCHLLTWTTSIVLPWSPCLLSQAASISPPHRTQNKLKVRHQEMFIEHHGPCLLKTFRGSPLHFVLFPGSVATGQQQCNGGFPGILNWCGSRERSKKSPCLPWPPGMTIRGLPRRVGGGPWQLGLTQGSRFVLNLQWQDAQHRPSFPSFLRQGKGVGAGASLRFCPAGACPRAPSVPWKAGGGVGLEQPCWRDWEGCESDSSHLKDLLGFRLLLSTCHTLAHCSPRELDGFGFYLCPNLTHRGTQGECPCPVTYLRYARAGI